MSHIFVFIVATQLLPNCHLQLQHPPTEEVLIRQSLSQCVRIAAERFFDQDKTIFYSLPLREVDRNQSSSFNLDRLILFELTKDCNWALFVQNLAKPQKTRPALLRKPNVYILQIRKIDDLYDSIKILRSYDNWNPHAKFLIISPRIIDNPRVLATKAMKKLWEVHVVNGIIFLPNLKNHTLFLAYSWFPYHDGNCADDFDRVTYIDSCSFGKNSEFVHWFPNKIPKKFSNCEIKVRIIDIPPYVINVPNGTWSNSSISNYRGVEVNLLDVIAETCNLRMFYYKSAELVDWGYIFDNGTITGNLRLLHEEVDDISIGAYAKTTQRTLLFDNSFYRFESLVFCVPYSIKKNQLETITKIIGVGAYLLTLIVFVTVTGLIWLTSKSDLSAYQNFGSLTLNTFAALLNFPVSVLPTTSKVRFFLAMLLMYSFCIIIAYQTLLTSALSSVGQKQEINQLEDLLKTDYKIYFPWTSRRYFATDSSNSKLNSINAAILTKWATCDNTYVCLDKVAFQRNAAVCFPKLLTEYISDSYRTEKNDPLIYCFDKSVVSYPLAIMMRKGFQLFERFDTLIDRIISAGFLEKWEKDILNTRYENFILNADLDQEDTGQDLNFETLIPVFGIWCAGLVLASLVFICEVVSWRWVNGKLVENCCLRGK